MDSVGFSLHRSLKSFLPFGSATPQHVFIYTGILEPCISGRRKITLSNQLSTSPDLTGSGSEVI